MKQSNSGDKLAKILQDRMKKVNQNASTTYLEFGTIVSKGLKIDGVNDIIPKSMYRVCSHLKDSKKTTSSEGHTHTVNATGLSNGDRVLVGWASGTPVIIDTI